MQYNPPMHQQGGWPLLSIGSPPPIPTHRGPNPILLSLLPRLPYGGDANCGWPSPSIVGGEALQFYGPYYSMGQRWILAVSLPKGIMVK